MTDTDQYWQIRQILDPLFWLALAAVIASLAYSAIVADAYFRGDPVWRDIAMATEPLAKGLAFFIPSIDRVYEHLASRGDVERAMLARHLYAAAWCITLAALLPLYPRIKSVLPDLIKHPSRYRIPWDQSAHHPSFKVPPENIGLGICLGCTALFGFDAWFGRFARGTPSFAKNMVHQRDLDLVRLSFTAPIFVSATIGAFLIVLTKRGNRTKH